MKTKRLDFELLRIFSIFLVVYNHTQYRGFELYLVDGCQGINYVLSLVLSVLCKMGVPLFLAVSGGLLLHRDETIKQVLLKRVLRIAVALLVFSGILYGFWYRWGMLESYSLGDFLARVWHQGISIPYWYLYAYMALMLALPLLRPMVRSMRDSTFVYLILLYFLYYGVMVPLGHIMGWGTVNEDFSIPLVSSTAFYFLMGYYFTHRFHWDSLRWRHIGILTALSVISVALCCCEIHMLGNAENLREGAVILPTATVYLLFGYIVRNHPIPERAGKVISSLGGCVFGTYLLEGILRVELLGIYRFLEPKLHVLPACFVWVIAVVLCGMAVTWILRRIPGVKKIL